MKSHFECELFRCPITNNNEIVQKGANFSERYLQFHRTNIWVIFQLWNTTHLVGLLKCLSCSVNQCELAYQTSTNRAKFRYTFYIPASFCFLFLFWIVLEICAVCQKNNVIHHGPTGIYRMSLVILIALRFRSNLSFNINYFHYAFLWYLIFITNIFQFSIIRAIEYVVFLTESDFKHDFGMR